MPDGIVRPSQSPELEVGGFYFAGDDQLRITSWNSLANVRVVVTGRFVHADDGHIEAFSEVHTPNTNRTAASDTYGRARGWLTDLSVLVTGATPQRGQTFVRVDVVRGLGAGAIALSTFIQGYVTATQRLAYPGSIVSDSLTGPGTMRSITGTDPAAGSEISETVPTGARWRYVSLRASLVTDATVANRTPNIFFDDGANVYAAAGVNFNHAASTTLAYSFDAVAVTQVQTSLNAQVSTPGNLVLAAGHRFRTSTGSLQAGDNWGAPQYAVEEWLEAI